MPNCIVACGSWVEGLRTSSPKTRLYPPTYSSSFPFLKIGVLMVVFQLLGRIPLDHLMWMNLRMTYLPAWPRWLIISLCILSSPGDLRTFSFRRAFENSDLPCSTAPWRICLPWDTACRKRRLKVSNRLATWWWPYYKDTTRIGRGLPKRV